MSEYHTFMRKWNQEEGINSFYGSDKGRFLKDWNEFKIRANPPKAKALAPKEPEVPPEPRRNAAEQVFTNPDLLKQIGSFIPKPKPFPLFGNDIFRGMTDIEKTLTRAMIAYYSEQDNDFERFNREDRNGNPVPIRGALKALTDDIAKDLKLPKNWLKQGDAVMEKYGMDYGNYKQKTQMIRRK
jgi:hypothetical protein